MKASSISSSLLLMILSMIMITIPLVSVSSLVEEFSSHDPLEFHKLSMEKYLEMRKDTEKYPELTMDNDSPFMEMGKEYAIKRNMLKDEKELTNNFQLSANSDGSSFLMKLPSIETTDQLLLSAVSNQALERGLTILPEQASAMAVQFNEEVGMGAISRAGGLVMGSDSGWLKFAESKLKKENSMDHHSLLWEIGSDIAEKFHKEQGGFNLTHERLLLDNMKEWFLKGGGQLRYVEPSITKENGFKLITVEDVQPEEAVVTIPMKLIMCAQTARNVLIDRRGKYLGEELSETFAKSEILGMAIFVLHEYYKEMNGKGSKWGPFLRTLSVRFLSTEVVNMLKGTSSMNQLKQWLKAADAFMWWTVGSQGPCTPTTNICNSKPNDRHGDHRFNLHQIRWAYWMVKQNAVRVKHMTTGLEFIALVPFYNMMDKRLGKGGGITFDRDGMISIRVGEGQEEGMAVGIHPGNITDPEHFLRYYSIPKDDNPNSFIALNLPGTIPKGSKFHYCLKGTSKERRKDECGGSYKSEAMFWKSKVLEEWRKQLNLPPRLGNLRMWAMRLHMYGDGEEVERLDTANKLIAGLPLPEDQMPAEEQLMLLGMAKTADEASVIMYGNAERPPPQLYAAPDPDEDPEAKKYMENLAMLALQAQNAILTGNTILNATREVLKETTAFFLHGVLPKGGLDQLDEFLMKKIGMLSHCGFENDMKILKGNITEQLMCAMRVHLMNETEMGVFCPENVRFWEDQCHSVEFQNFTAITESNELAVIDALRKSISALMSNYASTIEEDKLVLSSEQYHRSSISYNAVLYRMREKEMLQATVEYLDVYEASVKNGSVYFQLDEKARERALADIREEEQKAFVASIQERAKERLPVAMIEVDLGGAEGSPPKVNLTLEEGRSVRDTVIMFCKANNVSISNVDVLEKALRARIVSPPPLLLMLGVVIPTGDRVILAIPESSNTTVEVNVFCARYNITTTDKCDEVQKRVDERLHVPFLRNVLLVVPIDAPDSRKLQMIIRQGEQHDLRQFVSDFFQLYKMSFDYVNGMVQEISKRLPPPILQLPVALPQKRKVFMTITENDNATAVVEGFCNYFELDDNAKIQLMKHARNGLAPGSMMIN